MKPSAGSFRFPGPAAPTLGLSALVLLLAALYWPSAVWINAAVRETDSYYTHGWLLLAAIALLLWPRRAALSAAPVRPTRAGLPLLAAGLALNLFGLAFRINFLAAWSLFPVLAGLSLLNWGLRRTRVLFGPLLLLIFFIPLPGFAVIALAFRLKVASVRSALLLVRLLGIEAWLSGFQVVLPAAPPGEPLAIGDPCAGLRSLISFGAVGGVCAYLFPFSPLRRLTAVFAALALAPVANALRVALLIVLRQLLGPSAVRGGYHIVIGVGVYAACLLCYLQVLRWLIPSPAPPPSTSA